MRYYIYQPDANNYAGIGTSSEAHDEVVDIHYCDVPLSPTWTPIVFNGFEDNPPEEGDFPSLTGCPVLISRLLRTPKQFDTSNEVYPTFILSFYWLNS